MPIVTIKITLHSCSILSGFRSSIISAMVYPSSNLVYFGSVSTLLTFVKSYMVSVFDFGSSVLTIINIK